MRCAGQVLRVPGQGAAVLGLLAMLLLVPLRPLRVRAGSARRHAARHAGGSGLDVHAGRRVCVMFNDQGSPRGEREVKAPNWWMGMAERRDRQRDADVERDAEPRSRDGRQRRATATSSRSARPSRATAHRSSASARLPDAGRGGLAAAARERVCAHAGGRAGRRARARAGRVHAPLVGGREPDVAARPPHLRLDPHRDGRAHRGARSRPLPGRVVAVPRRASPTRTAGTSWIPARSTRGRCAAGTVRAGVDLPGVARIPDAAGGARGRRRAPDDGVGDRGDSRARRDRRRSRVAWGRNRKLGRHLRRVPRRDDARRCRGTARSSGASKRRRSRPTSCAPACTRRGRPQDGARDRDRRAGFRRRRQRRRDADDLAPAAWDVAAGGQITGYAVPRRCRRSTANRRGRSRCSCASARRRCIAWSIRRSPDTRCERSESEAEQ